MGVVECELAGDVAAIGEVDVVVPVGSSSIGVLGLDGLQDTGVGAFVEFAEVVAIEQVELAFFAGDDEEMRMRAGLRSEQDGALAAEVPIVRVHDFLVEGSEVVADDELVAVEVKLEDGVAVVAAAGLAGVEVSVAGGDVDVAGVVDGGACVGLPDAGVVAVGRGVEDGALAERVGVVGHDPAVVGSYVAG